MKPRRNAVKTTTYVAGILAVISALIAAVLLLMSALGIIFPRKHNITLRTNSHSYTYSGEDYDGSAPWISRGSLLEGHEIEVLDVAHYSRVGEYKNKPEYRIVDSLGADVTNMYNVTEGFGSFSITPRKIVVQSASKEKRYDGTPLVSDDITLLYSDLLEGHSFVCTAPTAITLPGEVQINPSYVILDKDGNDVTDQYSAEGDLGTLRVLPIDITVTTAGAVKEYDGKAISSDKWEHTGGRLLNGHKLEVVCSASILDVGTAENIPDVKIYSLSGSDVSQLYNITVVAGILEVKPLNLYIYTGSAEKAYDGEVLSCNEWRIVAGKLADGETIEPVGFTSVKNAGDHRNEIRFRISDKNGNDVTSRYKINLSAGTLSISPRAITIRTGSASKKYDASPLKCYEYDIINGELCSGDKLMVSLTSIVNIGYTENFIVALNIYRTDNSGNRVYVTSNYRITYDYGTLTVTP